MDRWTGGIGTPRARWNVPGRLAEKDAPAMRSIHPNEAGLAALCSLCDDDDLLDDFERVLKPKAET